MIRQAIVPPMPGPDNKDGQRRFLETLSECLQGMMLPQTSKPPEGGILEIRAFGPLVFIRYEGSAQNVILPFRPDGDMPLLCNAGNGLIDAGEKRLAFNYGGLKIASGWCVSSGRVR